MKRRITNWKGQVVLLLTLCIMLFTGCGAVDTAIDSWAQEQADAALATMPAPSYEPAKTNEPETSVQPAATVTTEPTAQPAAEPTKTPAAEPTIAATQASAKTETQAPAEGGTDTIERTGSYTSADDVALYLNTYGELPDNFITKKEAQDLGWSGGSLEPYAPGKCIGGDKFGNYEGILPEGSYHECDIDTLGKKSRGAKRIVYSSDGSIYYTEDHYESFEQLY